MKKKLSRLMIAILIIGLVNTGLLGYLASEKIVQNIQNRPILISKEVDNGQTYAMAKEAGKPMIVWFYTDWCGYCQKFAPTFKKLTKDKQIKEKFAIAFVNAENPANQGILDEFKVEGYPTLYMINGDKKETVALTSLFVPKAHESLKEKFLEFLN